MTFILTTINEGGGRGVYWNLHVCVCLSVHLSLLNSSTFCNKTLWNVASSYAGVSLKNIKLLSSRSRPQWRLYNQNMTVTKQANLHKKHTHTNTPSETSMTAGILKQDQSTRNMILIRQYETMQMFTAEFLPYLPLSSHHIICTSCNLLVYIIHHIIY